VATAKLDIMNMWELMLGNVEYLDTMLRIVEMDVVRRFQHVNR